MINKAHKILIVADTLDQEKSSGAKGRIALIQGFIDQGYALKIWHYSRKDVLINGATVVSIPENKSSWSYIKAKAQILFQRITGRNINHWVESRRGFSYTHDYDVKSIQAAIQKESPEEYDYVIALSYASSFRAHKALLQLPQWYHKFLPYIHDPFPMHSYPRPYDWVEPGHQKKRDFFIALYKAAPAIIYPSKMLGDWMESYYPTGKNKAVTIPHLMVKSLKDTGVYPSYFDISKFNILHAGSLMSARNPIILLKAFVAFLEEFPEAKDSARLIMVSGPSIFHKEMTALSQEFPQIVLSPDKEAFAATYNMQQQAAVNIVLEAKGPASPFLPGKVPHCVAANKPILLLGPYYSETRRILGTDYPYWSEINDQERIKSLISELYQLWQLHHGQLLLNRPDLQEYLSSSSIINAFEIIKDA
jgi:glycosyltransferase involved in cell wall biosynthesis